MHVISWLGRVFHHLTLQSTSAQLWLISQQLRQDSLIWTTLILSTKRVGLVNQAIKSFQVLLQARLGIIVLNLHQLLLANIAASARELTTFDTSGGRKHTEIPR